MNNLNSVLSISSCFSGIFSRVFSLGLLFIGAGGWSQGGARAVLQFYPSCSKQAEMISSAAMKAGFAGGLVVDFPHRLRTLSF